MLLGGIRDMATVPDMLFIVDVRREDTAVHEANLLGVPIVAMVDTNCDPSVIDYVIPSNDDAIRAIKLIVGKIADAVLEGRAMRKDFDEEMPRDSAAAFDIDAELTDADLLGDATLAKLEAQRSLEEPVEAEGETEEAFPDFEDMKDEPVEVEGSDAAETTDDVSLPVEVVEDEVQEDETPAEDTPEDETEEDEAKS